MSLKKIFFPLVLLSFFLFATYQLFHHVVADLYASKAKQEIKAKDYAAAEQHLSKSLLYSEDSPEYHYMHAQSLYALATESQDFSATLGFLRRAQEHFQRSIELNPREGDSWLELAQACWWLGKFPGFERELENAESYFLRALETDPNNGMFLYAMVNYYLFSVKPENSLLYLQRLAMVYPNAYHHLKAHPEWSNSLREPFRPGLKLAINNPLSGLQALGMLGFMAEEEKDWLGAIGYTEQFISRSGSGITGEPYVNLGRLCLQLPDHSRAKTAFLQALKLSKTREKSLQSLLAPCVQADVFDLYIDLCEETAKFDKTVRNNLPLILGKAYFQHNDAEAAQHYLQQSLEMKETAETRRYLAEIALRKSDWDAAEIQSQRATILDSRNSHCYFLLARSLEAQKKYKPALEAVSEAIRHASLPQEGYYAMQGSLCWTLGDYKGAIIAWKAAHELVPRNANYLRQIAEGYRMLNDFSSAEQYYLAAISLSPQGETLRTELEAVRMQKQ